ncbi:MAG TPA: putative Ig domain-containing protein [Kineosporiaceae bacterium]
MPFSTTPGDSRRRRGLRYRAAILSAAVAVAGAVATPATATAAGPRLDLRALVVDDGSAWVKGITDQFTLEGVPFTDVKLSDAARPTITATYLSSSTEAFFNAVVVPDDLGGGLPATEMGALATFEAQFGVRQVDAYQWANPTVGLNYAASPNGFVGDLTGLTGTVTTAAQADGFGYLSGSLPIGVGTYGYIATNADTTGVMPAGGTFTPFVTLPIPGSTTPGSLVGVYANGGVQKLVITGAMMTSLSHFRLLAHGIVSWVTRGVHFGYNRNYLTFHFDDAFSYDARWDAVHHCTPGEDCPATVTTTTPDIRMTAADVAQVVAWEQANGYTITLPFNGYYSVNDANGTPWNGTDGLTTALVANKGSFAWLNHGYEHIFQGCVQNFTVVPWVCTTTNGQPVAADGSNISWVSQSAIASEITNNVAQGHALGLPFDPQEYLSGEHSGLFLTPQQPIDNPNFAAAVTAQGIRYIGADASREPGARLVGGATTVPRHPVAVYYNVSTTAEEVSEYNWFYTSRTAGGSGYCDDNPSTATCLAGPLDATTGFASSIVPSDAANDLRFILSNDPRPFYAHVSNLTGPDYLGLQLLSSIITTYRNAFTPATPLVNLNLTQASDALTRQQSWAAAGMGVSPSVTGYVQDGIVTVTNTGASAAPVTVPGGTTVNGAAFGAAYGGERSGWVNGSATLALPGAATSFTSAATATFTVGAAGTFTVTTAPAATAVTETGALPSGITFADNANGTATLAGTPAAGTAGSYPLTLTASNGSGPVTQAFTLVVNAAPTFTSAASTAVTAGTSFSFPVTTTGTPAATLTLAGTLPAGVTFTPGTGGTATLAGTTAATLKGSFPLTFTATNSIGTATQKFTLTVGTAPTITSSATATATVGTALAKGILTSGSPAATVTVTGLPAGLSFAATVSGGGLITGTPAPGTGGTYAVTVTATNLLGKATQTLALTVRELPTFTSAASVSATLGTPLTFTVTTKGYPLPTLSTSGSLPSGVRIKVNGDGSATISGTPTVRGTFRLTIAARNVVGTVSQAFTLTVI